MAQFHMSPNTGKMEKCGADPSKPRARGCDFAGRDDVYHVEAATLAEANTLMAAEEERRNAGNLMGSSGATTASGDAEEALALLRGELGDDAPEVTDDEQGAADDLIARLAERYPAGVTDPWDDGTRGFDSAYSERAVVAAERQVYELEEDLKTRVAEEMGTRSGYISDEDRGQYHYLLEEYKATDVAYMSALDDLNLAEDYRSGVLGRMKLDQEIDKAENDLVDASTRLSRERSVIDKKAAEIAAFEHGKNPSGEKLKATADIYESSRELQLKSSAPYHSALADREEAASRLEIMRLRRDSTTLASVASLKNAMESAKVGDTVASSGDLRAYAGRRGDDHWERLNEVVEHSMDLRERTRESAAADRAGQQKRARDEALDNAVENYGRLVGSYESKVYQDEFIRNDEDLKEAMAREKAVDARVDNMGRVKVAMDLAEVLSDDRTVDKVSIPGGFTRARPVGDDYEIVEGTPWKKGDVLVPVKMVKNKAGSVDAAVDDDAIADDPRLVLEFQPLGQSRRK